MEANQHTINFNPAVKFARHSLGPALGNPDRTSNAHAKLKELLYPAIPTEVFATYWSFAAKRQKIFLDRFNRLSPPWTDDSVLAHHRFTNTYRAADRVSQYLISHVQYNRKWSPEDLFFRTILFKFFNRIDTWKKLVAECDEPQWSTFSVERFERVLDTALAAGNRIYSAAYIMPSGGPKSRFRRKHQMHLHLIERMMKDGLPAKVAAAKSMEAVFRLLRGYPTLGDFLAYQYTIDLNYSTLINFNEDDFVVAGPGAREGIHKCFRDLGGKDLIWIIQQTTKTQDDALNALNLPLIRLWGRPLHLIDCQNIFCEVAKYARVYHPEFTPPAGRTRIKQKFLPAPQPIEYMLPPKWGISVPKLSTSKNVARI